MAAKKLTFEESMQQLEAIVESLSDGKLTLDEMTKLYEKGMTLAKRCSEELDHYEAKILKLSAESGEITEDIQ